MALQEREENPLALPGVLGDAALLNRLRPLRKLREAVRRRGYEFLPADRIAGVHSMFPLLELTEILGKKRIPFRRTAEAAKQLLARTPDVAMSPRLFRDICVSNYVAHESAHAFFYETALASEGRLTPDRYVETLLISEAFAMAFEQFVALAAAVDGRRTTALFLAMNAYVAPTDILRNRRVGADEVRSAAETAVRMPKPVLTFLVAVNLISLVRPRAGGAKAGLAEGLANLLGVGGLASRELQTLLGIGLHVDFDFRSTMQRNFYEYLGLDREYSQFIAQPLDDLFPGSTGFTAYLPEVLTALVDREREEAYG